MCFHLLAPLSRAMNGWPARLTTHLSPRERHEHRRPLIGRMLKHSLLIHAEGADTHFISMSLANADLSPEDLPYGQGTGRGASLAGRWQCEQVTILLYVSRGKKRTKVTHSRRTPCCHSNAFHSVSFTVPLDEVNQACSTLGKTEKLRRISRYGVHYSWTSTPRLKGRRPSKRQRCCPPGKQSDALEQGSARISLLRTYVDTCPSIC
jgi:hypothetical protein